MSQLNFTPHLLNRLRMRQVALLLATANQGTLRAASKTLGMTQPAATKMLHELEDTLGQALFDRVGRGLKLTAAGQCALHYFEGLQGSIEALGRELGQIKQGNAGRLRVGGIMAASPVLMTDALIALKNIYPLLTVEVSLDTSDRLLAALSEGSLDVVIGRMVNESAPEFVFEPIEDELLAVVVGCQHPLARRKTLSFEALLGYPWMMQALGSPMRSVIEQAFAQHHAPLPKGLIETTSILTTTHYIAQTSCIAVLPLSIATHYAQHGLLAILPYALLPKLAAYGSIVARNRPLNQSAAAFLEQLHRAKAVRI